MIYLGIDNGLYGAVARIREERRDSTVRDAAGTVIGTGDHFAREVEVWPAPTLTVTVPAGKGKKQRDRRLFDLGAMWDLLKKAVGTASLETIFAALEFAQAFPEQGRTAIFNYGHGSGAWEMALVTLEIPYTKVQPATWKRSMLHGLPGRDKGAAVVAAKRLFPGANLRPTPAARKDSDGMAEALLLAEYARRTATAVVEPSRAGA